MKITKNISYGITDKNHFIAVKLSFLLKLNHRLDVDHEI